MRIFRKLVQAAFQIEGYAVFLQPVTGLADIFGIERDQLGNVKVGAVGHEIFYHALNGVIRYAQILLHPGTHNDLVPAADGDGAAHEGHLFQKDNVKTKLSGSDRCRHAGSAAADDDKVGIKFFLKLRLFLFHSSCFQGFRVSACLRNAVRGSGKNRLGCNGCPRYHINAERLIVHDRSRKSLNGSGTDAVGLGMFGNIYRFNRVFREGNLNLYVAVSSRGGRLIGSRRVGCAEDRCAHHRGGRQRAGSC